MKTEQACRSALIMMALVSACAMRSTADSQYKFDENDAKTYVVTVPEGETNEISSAAIGVLTRNEATSFVKRGLGALQVSCDISAYTGGVVIEEGVYLSCPSVSQNPTLGSSSSPVTIKSGATLALSTKKDNTYLSGHTISFEGDGYGGQGALVNCRGNAMQSNPTFGKDLVLTGDAKVATYASQWFYLVQDWGVIDFGGHVLTLYGKNYPVVFEKSGYHVQPSGSGVVATGKGIEFSGNIGYNYFSAPLSIEDGAMCVLQKVGGYYQCPMTLKTGSKVRILGTCTYEGKVILNDPVRNEFDLNTNTATVNKVISGGGIYVPGSGCLKIGNTGNSFTNGIVLADGAVLNLGGYSALPNKGALVMTNSSVVAVGSHATGATWTLPPLVVHGAGLVSQATGTWRTSVTKTGDGELVYDSWIGSNELKLEGGSLRFPTSSYSGSGQGAVDGHPYFKTITARPGTAIDFSNFEYYCAYLNGFTAISNCPIFRVNTKWSFSAADAVAGGCVKTSGAILLDGGVPLEWSVAGVKARGRRTYTVMHAEGGITITNGFGKNNVETKNGDFGDTWKLSLSADGKSLLLDHYPRGLVLMVR